MAVDSTGSVYVAGVVSGTLDDQMYTSGTAPSTDILLLKYNSSGSWQWTRLRGSTGSDFGYWGEKIDFVISNLSMKSFTMRLICTVAVDSSTNDVYVTGSVAGTVDSQSYSAGNDIVLLKYDSSGNWQWTQLRGTTGNDATFSGE